MKRHKQYSGLSIFHTLVLYFAVIGLVTALLSGMVHYSRTAGFIREDMMRRLAINVKNTAEYFDKTYTASIEKDLVYLESSAGLDGLLTIEQGRLFLMRPEVEEQFIRLTSSDAKYTALMFFNALGDRLINVERNKRVRNYSSLQQLQNEGGISQQLVALYERLSSVPPRTILFSGPFASENGGHTVLAGIAKLEPDIGGFGGAIISLVNLEEYLKYLSGLSMFNRSVVWLFDGSEQVILSPDLREDAIDPRSNFRSTDAAGQNSFVQFQDIKLGSDQNTILKLAYSLPPDILAKEMQQTFLIAFLLGLAVLFVSVLIALFVSRQFSNPITGLINTSISISQGDFQARTSTDIHGELGLLAKSINEMTENLQNTTVSHDYVDNILQSMFDPLIVISPGHAVRTVNVAACDLLGYSEAELVGSPFSQIFNTALLEKSDEVNERSLKVLVDNLETTFITKNGNEIPVIFSSSLISGPTGETIGYVCVAKDITERLKTERELAEANKKLVEIAHKAGMADIATGILHNLGNVLNSANASAEETKQIVKTSKIKSFINANHLLEEHRDHIAEFLSSDERGKKLPDFYLKLGAVLLEENERIGKSMRRIEDKISTMKGIVQTQQEYAKAEFHAEHEELPKIIKDVLKIQKDLIKSNGVHVQGDYNKPLRCKVHKYKLVQVLLNLVKNAIEAMKGNDLLNKTKTLTIETGSDDAIIDFIRISDNGSGIASEDLIKIFSHGFTTKDKGHGFGLHASANAMTEMGGNIIAESAGVNCGATFTVKFSVCSVDHQEII